MKEEEIIFIGKKRIILRRKATGIDRTREVALIIMGPQFEYKKDISISGK